jgi:glutathionylspermidine synthase
MKRQNIVPRVNFKEKLEELSFEFHSLDNPYWDVSVYYEFTMAQVDQLEKATNDLFEMCLKAVQHVIDNNLFEKMCIDPMMVELILTSWENEEASVYGRFDFGYDGINPPKMLEFNADTPTSLYEGSVVQWNWLQEVFKEKDQFNSIHERLIDYWKSCLEYFDDEVLHFTSVDTIEDFTTTEYLRDTAFQAGLRTKYVKLDDIGWDEDAREFVDENNEVILNIFKLYPWEWLISEEFGPHILEAKDVTRWIEPAWKSILSNKGILPILWELFPDHPNLLPAYFDNPHFMSDYVEKPIYSREGANVSIYRNRELSTSVGGEYGEEGYIYQKLYDLPNFDMNYPIIGSWVIGGESAGIGIRESTTEITDNLSRFIPHIINN